MEEGRVTFIIMRGPRRLTTVMFIITEGGRGRRFRCPVAATTMSFPVKPPLTMDTSIITGGEQEKTTGQEPKPLYGRVWLRQVHQHKLRPCGGGKMQLGAFIDSC